MIVSAYRAAAGFLSRIYARLFKENGSRNAVAIVRRHVGRDVEIYRVCDNPEGLAIYYGKPREPFWCVYVSRNDGMDGMVFRSSRVVLVSKATGKILYDGDAGDEG